MTAPVVPLRAAGHVAEAAGAALAVVSRHLDRCKLSARTVRAYKRQAAAYTTWLTLGDFGDGVVAAVVHAADLAVLGGGEAGGLAAQPAAGAGDGHALAGALADQGGLELGDDGEDLQEHPGHRVVPVVNRAAEGEPDATVGELGEDGQGVGDGAGEAVELGDGEGVAVAGCGQGLVQAGPGPAGAGQPLVQVDAVGGDAERGELLALAGQVLTGGTAPGIADINTHPGFLPVTVEVPVRDIFTGQAN